jgi:hypothetical protein
MNFCVKDLCNLMMEKFVATVGFMIGVMMKKIKEIYML